MEEHAKARAWRESLGLSRRQLADLTGLSDQAIMWYEKGVQPPTKREGGGKATPWWIWQRYKRACHSVAVELQRGEKFEW